MAGAARNKSRHDEVESHTEQRIPGCDDGLTAIEMQDPTLSPWSPRVEGVLTMQVEGAGHQPFDVIGQAGEDLGVIALVEAIDVPFNGVLDQLPRRRLRSFLLILRPCFSSNSASRAFRSRRSSLIAWPWLSLGRVEGCSLGPEGDQGTGGSYVIGIDFSVPVRRHAPEQLRIDDKVGLQDASV